MKYYYNKEDFTDLKKKNNFKTLIVLIIISLLTFYLYLDFNFIKGVTPNAFNTFTESKTDFKYSNYLFNWDDLSLFMSLVTIIILGILVYSIKKTVTPITIPKSLTELIPEELPFIKISSYNGTNNESIRITLRDFFLDLNWNKTSGPPYKWRIKISLHSTGSMPKESYRYLADVLLLEEEIESNLTTFNKIISAKELPRHLITINYWIQYLNLVKKK